MSREQRAGQPLMVGSTVTATKEQISSEVAGETVILDLKGGVYFGLDAIGSRVWSLIQRPATVAEIRDALTREYDVDPERCERDVLALLGQMAERSLISVSNDATS